MSARADWLQLQVSTTPHKDYAFTNCIYTSPADFSALVGGSQSPPSEILVELKKDSSSATSQFMLRPLSRVQPGLVSLNGLHRGYLNVQLDQPVLLAAFRPPSEKFVCSDIEFGVSSLRRGRSGATVTVDCKELAAEIALQFKNQVFSPLQKIAHKFKGAVPVQLEVRSLAVASLSEDDGKVASSLGQLLATTSLSFVKADNSDATLRLTGRVQKKSANQMVGVDFEKLGIGGLDKEFTKLFRRAFASRIFPPEVATKLGIKHVRGLMLYGPPGCGKTLIARQISKVLQGEDSENAREPKIVSGPEVLNKYVGGSEEKIRELFKEAEEEQAMAGDDSELHVIIFDEIDAICKQRGSTRDGTGVGDSVVNQLLSKIDGVNSLNNILLIGMTNRLDMIDSALLRPGRFEVHIEIGLPDEAGRVQILNIHTGSMRKSNYLGSDVSIVDLAKQTKNFSGAEIEGLVKSASSFAFLRHVGQGADLTSVTDLDNFTVSKADFDNALTEVKPSFGVQGEEELHLYYRNGIVNYGEAFKQLDETLRDLASQVEKTDNTPLLSVLISGPTGSGKTALVAKMASNSGFPFIKMITPDLFIGLHEQVKCSKLVDIFENAYKSPLSLIIIDDVERIIDYVAHGPVFANKVLQALLVLINKPPPVKERKLMIVATTAIHSRLEDLGLSVVFNYTLIVPLLTTIEEIEIVLRQMLHLPKDGQQDEKEKAMIAEEELVEIAATCQRPIAIKKFLMILERAKKDVEMVSCNRFMYCLHSVGY